MDAGERIKQARKNAGLSQKELGQKLDMSPVMISQYETGKRIPKLATLQKIADALNLSISHFLTGKMFLSLGEKDLHEWYKTFGETKSDKINAAFEKLNDDGQDKAIEQVELLTEIPKYRKEDTPDES